MTFEGPGAISVKLEEGPHELRGTRRTFHVNDTLNPPEKIKVRWTGAAPWDFSDGPPRSRPWSLTYVRSAIEPDHEGDWTYAFSLGTTEALD